MYVNVCKYEQAHTNTYISTLAILWHCQFEKFIPVFSWVIVIVYVWHHSYIDISNVHTYTHTHKMKIVYGELYIHMCKCAAHFDHYFEHYAVSLLFAHLNFGFKSVVIAAKYMTLTLFFYLSLSLSCPWAWSFILSYIKIPILHFT